MPFPERQKGKKLFKINADKEATSILKYIATVDKKIEEVCRRDSKKLFFTSTAKIKGKVQL